MLGAQTALRADLLNYYARPGPLTVPHDQAHLLANLPTAIPSLVKIVQSVIVHIFWAERYGLTLSEERKEVVYLRFIPKVLARIAESDARRLMVPRDPDRKLVGNCRDHSTLLCSILRQQRVPARALRLRRVLHA
jgi:hypothetical protein